MSWSLPRCRRSESGGRRCARRARARRRPRPCRAASAQRSRAATSSSRICSSSSRWWPFGSSVALSARPSAPNPSGWRVKRSGSAIERYWWMRACASGCARTSRALRLRRLERLLAVRDPVRVAGEHVPQLPLVEARDAARRAARGGASRAAGRTGSPRRRRSAPAARGAAGRAGRSRSRPTCRRRRRACPRSGARGSRGRRCRRGRGSAASRDASSTSFSSPSAIGGRPRPAWMRIGTRRSAASAKTGTSRSSFEQELLRARMELDPAGAEVEAATRLLDRPLVEVEPHERDEPAVRARRELERPVVPGAEARVPVGLVEAEHVRARDAVAVHPAEQLVVDADHPVDVVAEMRVRVEDVEIGRQAGAHPLVPVGGDLPCPLERIHSSNLPRAVPTSCQVCKGHFRRDAAASSKGAVHFPPIGGSMKRVYLLVLLSALALPLRPRRPAAAVRAASSSARSTPPAATAVPSTPTTTSSCSTAARALSPSAAGRSSTHRPPARAGSRPR